MSKASLKRSAAALSVPALQRTLDTSPATGNRYVPRSIGRGHWGVWDAQENRFVPVEELMTLPLDHVLNANVKHH